MFIDYLSIFAMKTIYKQLVARYRNSRGFFDLYSIFSNCRNINNEWCRKDEKKIYFEILHIFLDMYDFYSYEHVCVQNIFLKFSKRFSDRNSSLDYLLKGLKNWEFTKPVQQVLISQYLS